MQGQACDTWQVVRCLHARRLLVCNHIDGKHGKGDDNRNGPGTVQLPADGPQTARRIPVLRPAFRLSPAPHGHLHIVCNLHTAPLWARITVPRARRGGGCVRQRHTNPENVAPMCAARVARPVEDCALYGNPSARILPPSYAFSHRKMDRESPHKLRGFR